MLKIFDLHNDYILKLSGNKREKYISKSAGLNNIVSAVWTSEFNTRESLSRIEESQEFVNSHKNLFLAIEDLHFLNAENLDTFLQSKPLYAGLTWNTCNCLAGGALEHGKLTTFGKKVVKSMEKYNIQVDTAHLNEDSFMDISKITTKPLFCSHTAFYGVNANPRNLKDYQLKMIIDSGGLVGLCLVSDFINGSKQCKVQDVVSQIEYFSCKFGINNLAIGTDFFGTKNLPKSITSYSELLNNLGTALTKIGYTEKSLNKIFFENAYNFLVGKS